MWQKIKALINAFKVKNEIEKEIPKMKSGWKTTEFWVSAVTILLSIFGAAGGFISPELTAKIAGIIAAVYALARAITKMTATTKDDEIIAKVEEMLKAKNILTSEVKQMGCEKKPKKPKK